MRRNEKFSLSSNQKPPKLTHKSIRLKKKTYFTKEQRRIPDQDMGKTNTSTEKPIGTNNVTNVGIISRYNRGLRTNPLRRYNPGIKRRNRRQL